VAEVAMQSGFHAARTIARRLRDDTGERRFRYRNLGTMATIARFRAVAYVGRVRVTGLAGWLLWLFVHLAFLTGFKNRLAAVANWAVVFLGHGRPQRTITTQQVLARTRASNQRGHQNASDPARSAARASPPPSSARQEPRPLR
jgi:NADH dehydrogenase